MNELKPCPFCGGEATVRYEPSFEVYYTHCDTCNAETGNTGLYQEKRKAIDAWNTRAVEVVRCRDCRKAYKSDEVVFCKMLSVPVEPWRFCSWGEPEQPPTEQAFDTI